MLDIALSEFNRHKMRTFLTGLGIVIAITAIVSLGSISAGMNEMIEGTMRQMGADKIIVMKELAMGGFGTPQIQSLDEDIAEELEGLYGVDDAVAVVRTAYLGAIPVLGGGEEQREFMQFTDFDFKEGGWFEDDDTDSIVLGKDLAEARGLSVGDTMEFDGTDLTVVGVVEAGEMRGANMLVFMPYGLSQDVFDLEGEANLIVIKPTDIALAPSIKQQIRDEYDDLDALTSEDMLEMAQSIIGTIAIVTLGIGFIASLVAAIGIIITMITSVSERKREIGIMKAVGAKRRVIIAQILQESVIISIASGITGLVIGYLLVDSLNAYLFAGMQLAAVTPLLAVGALVYGIVLALFSAIYPAFKASRIDPIEAIRS